MVIGCRLNILKALSYPITFEGIVFTAVTDGKDDIKTSIVQEKMKKI